MTNIDSDTSKSKRSAKEQHRRAIDALFAATEEELNATYRDQELTYTHAQIGSVNHQQASDALFAASAEDLNATYREPEAREQS